ncbi:TonB-dependent receptor [Bacteroides thetaiotaomicron]|jgi:tonB-linked outer membrane protein, susC/ragA family|uniref:TonB-dependent receptor n=2 Tax=Bacteroides thetaiotaomicron TaxID=818 RepID=A0AA46U753_BACT4|nr:TonB-dependent receptor [Bacteroides thetaiotaomicron]MCS2908412.1 TonB-dependent receptor [Bacteroides thetaiotaomicron]MDC2094090.1 TonB-dependent receptor [Bacteroides thetaiotaomicron]MDC2113519.1 TonB-dependent receptor [Bacteroides thetaiotaomicron]MDC2119040.1 TonB-dependent receptor [Bacteroides thetaiotaomicron]MDC2123502.1 TonB-dependent receptor [Bacteroides thetaiotaomicron]
MAQTKISGTVTDVDKNPLPGVSVVCKSTSQGTVTNLDGKYTIEINKGNTLTFSLIGMQTQDIKIASQSIINVIMHESTIELDEVVAIGYGTAKKSDLTSSIISVKPDELKNVKVGSAADALQGLATGVLISKGSFKPGGSSNIIIRGNGSFGNGGASTTPLYIIDGVMSNAGLDVIAPSDIESIEVLKDAASTAIYGSRASNGIILVTTKKGKTGKASITFNTNIGIQNLINKQKVLNASQFKEILDAATDNTYLWDKEEQRMFDEGRSTDWQDLITQSGVYQNYNLGITGGSEKTTYYLGLDWVDQEGIIKNTGYQKGNIRFNLDSKLNNWLTMGAKFNVIRSSTNSSNTDGVAGMNSLDQGTMGSAIASKPSAPIFNEDGTYYDNLLLRPNPVAAVTYFKNNFTQTRINASFNLEAEILKNLILRTENGTEYINNQSNVFQDSRMTGIYKNVNISDRENGEQFYLQTENTLTYQLNKGIHRLTAVGGFSASIFNWTMMSAQVLNASNITQNDNLGTGTPKSINSDKVKSTLASFFGRVNYSLADKYLLTVTLRADGSSRFAKGHKWGYFPSGGLAWRINQEDFLKDVNFLDNLKLRTSYGIVGNQEISSYQSMAQVDATSSRYTDYVFGGTLANGSRTSILAQPDLTWEKSRQFDLGLDFAFFKNRLSGSIDGYYKYTYDLLYNVPLPLESGYRTALVNVGAMKNRGIELTLNSVNIDTKDFTWQTSLNYSFNKNEIDKLYNDLERVGNYFVGQSINVIYTKRFGGIWQSDEAEIAKIYNAEPGDYKIIDRNRNNIIDDDDRDFVGQTTPQFFGSFSNTFKSHGFDLTIFLTYAGGHKIYNPFAYLDSYSPSANMSPDYYHNYWTPERPSNKYPRLGSTNSQLYETDGMYQKGDYIRLKNLELGYTLPRNIANKVYASNIRVYASVQNLVTFTKYTGFDVETSNANPYPACRVFMGGLTVNF